MLTEILEIAGALAILIAFAASQAQVLGTQTVTFLGLNLLGSFTLAAIAWSQDQWGFLLLEGAWAFISAWSLSRRLRSAPIRARRSDP